MILMIDDLAFSVLLNSISVVSSGHGTARVVLKAQCHEGITTLLPPLPVGAIGFMCLKNSSAFFGHGSYLIDHLFFRLEALSLCRTPTASLNGNIDITSAEKYFFYSTVFFVAESGKDEKLNRLDKLQKILDNQAGQDEMLRCIPRNVFSV